MLTSLVGVLFVLVLLGAAPPPALELDKRFQAMLTQLGHDNFDRRQQAERELIRLGPAILPLIDRVEPHPDLEVRNRLHRVRRAVGGAVEELRDALAALPPLPAEERAELPEGLKRLIQSAQPQSGDFLVSLAGAPRHPLHRQAVNAVVQTWDAMSPAQIETYLKHSLVPMVWHRQRYPCGVEAMVGLGYQLRHGWASRPPADRVQLSTSTTHFRDGKRYGEPYRYPYPSSGCTTGWMRTQDLAVGRHTAALEVAFELEHRGKKVTGSVRSAEVPFEVIADRRDDLIAPKDPKVARLVRESLAIGETEERKSEKMLIRVGGFREPDPWRPQITWTDPGGKPNGLHVPIWRVEQPLPVDLCFAVTIRVEGTREEYAGDPLIVYKGTTRPLGYFSPRDVQKLAHGRSGFVPVRLVLKPSRMHALSDPKIGAYFGEEIVSDVFRLKVGPAEKP
jgi:hypothetical protein